MKVPGEIMNQWKLEREHGDVEAIQQQTKEDGKDGISRVTISNALQTGNMSEETYEAIKLFYSEKRKKKQKMISDALK